MEYNIGVGINRPIVDWMKNYRLHNLVKHKCMYATIDMIKEFPELERVMGHIYVKDFEGPIHHFWCKDKQGQIYDPTETQFYGIIKYIEYNGRICRYCGANLNKRLDFSDLDIATDVFRIMHELFRDWYDQYCSINCMIDDFRGYVRSFAKKELELGYVIDMIGAAERYKNLMKEIKQVEVN